MNADIVEVTAAALALGGLLLLVSSLLSRVGNRLGVPVSLLFLAIGGPRPAALTGAPR